MKKLCLLTFTCILFLPIVFSVNVGSGIGIDVETEDFVPLVWMCDNRVVYDDATEPGRISNDSEELVERTQNYAFEGEQIEWTVLVMDKNGIQKVRDVYVVKDDGSGSQQIITGQDEVTFCGSIPSTNTDWQNVISLPRFDPNLGSLLDVELTFDAEMMSDIFVEHLSTSNPANFSVEVDGTVGLNYSDVSLLAPIFFAVGDEVDVFDGSVDFSGLSGRTFLDVTGSDSLTQSSGNLNDFIETFPGEDFDIDVFAQSGFQLIGPGNYQFIVLTNASAEACVTYTYETERVIITPGDGDIEANCVEGFQPDPTPFEFCNARILEEELNNFDPLVMRYYDCRVTVETPLSMYGEHWFRVQAEDLDGLIGTFDEWEYWFLNPIIALGIDGSISFTATRPGTSSYSETLTIMNDADDGSGVYMDMFISGTDFYDSGSAGTACPTSNVLRLGDGDSFCDLGTQFGGNSPFNNGAGDSFCYFATHGDYDTLGDARMDVEGYVGINYGIGFNDPAPFYGAFNGDGTGFEIIQGVQVGPYFPGNVLTPGAEMSVTFRLNLPEPCNGDFDSGAIYFWGEAV